MEVYAAIDLMNGRVVRLLKGSERNVITYPGRPEEYAVKWSSLGFTGIHVVDLDAAFGRGGNLEAVEKIVNASSVPVQVGGGVRSKERIERLLSMGVSRIILGSLALRDPELASKLGEQYGYGKFVIALDYSSNLEVLTEGWRKGSGLTLKEAYEIFSEKGFSRFLLTAKERDGLLRGPDRHTLSRLPSEIRRNSIVAGGVSTPEDVGSLRQMGFLGAVVGRALYEGRINFKRLLEAARDGC